MLKKMLKTLMTAIQALQEWQQRTPATIPAT